MISCVVVFDGRVTRVVYDDTHQGLLGSCVKFSQRVVVVIGVRGGGVAAPWIEKFKGKLCFQGKRKLLKIPEW